MNKIKILFQKIFKKKQKIEISEQEKARQIYNSICGKTIEMPPERESTMDFRFQR